MSQTLDVVLLSLTNNIAADVKALKAADGNLAALSTTAKGNLVAAINELWSLATAVGNTGQDLVAAYTAAKA